MAQLHPTEIVRNALNRDELDLLLLGRPDYQYIDRYVGPDVVSLLDVLYRQSAGGHQEEIKTRLLAAIKKVVNTYEGLRPVASCILYEASQRSPVDCFGQPHTEVSLGLPLEEIAAELKQNIRVFGFRLEKDKTGEGAKWPDGLYGDLRRLSGNTQRVGGPPFCD